MPKIELHGFGKEEANALKEKLREVVRSLKLEGDAVIETFDTQVESCEPPYVPRPYVHVCSTSEVESRNIVHEMTVRGVCVDTEIGPSFYLFLSASEIRRVYAALNGV
jgi:hypothetical protein